MFTHHLDHLRESVTLNTIKAFEFLRLQILGLFVPHRCFWAYCNPLPYHKRFLQEFYCPYADGRELSLSREIDAINGGPRLLRNGGVEITAFAEGFHWQENPEFYYRFGIRRNPRTLTGVTASGKLLLVTVDGRLPGWSVGASFRESALIMRSLGAVDAVNLDGGGSTTLSINQQLVNRPSDATRERPIADAIIIQP